MDRSLNVLVPHHEEGNDVRESAMGGKHQRSLSLSAKWASDKAMAIEYLRRQRDVMTWIETVLKRELPTTDLFEALKSGVVLREMMETLFPDVSNCMSPISRNYSKRMAPWKERENISVFLRQCKSIGMYDLSLFCTDDLYEGTNMVQVLFCVQHFMMFSEEHAGHLFKPIAKNEPAEFSNQELEMAMSKIEQAGVDTKALQGLMSANSSGVSEKVAGNEKESAVRAASESATALSKDEKLKSVKEEEPAQSEDCSDAKVSVQTEESGSDADVKEEVAQSEVISVSEHEPNTTEVFFDESTAAQDEEKFEVIKQVLSDMAAAVEVAETKVREKIIEERPRVEEVPSVETITTPEDAAAKEEEEEKEEGVVTEGLEDLAVEVEAGTTDQTNIDIELTDELANPTAESTDVPTEVTPAEETARTQPLAEVKDNVADSADDKPQQTDDDELEAKAMAKCTCGRCTIM